MKKTPDWTGRKTLHFEEDADRGSEYQVLFEISPNPTWIFDLATLSILAVNDTALVLFGYTREDFLNLTLQDLLPPQDISKFLKSFNDGSENPKSSSIIYANWGHKKRDDTYIDLPVHSRSVVFQGHPARMVVASTDFKSTTTEFVPRNLDQEMRLLMEQMPQVLWTTDQELRFTSSTGAGLAGLSMKPNQAVGMTMFEYFQTDDRDYEPILAHRRALIGESTSYVSEWMGRTFQSYVEPIVDANGNITGTIGVALDITEHKLVEKKLREAEAKLRNLIERIPAITYIAEFGRAGKWVFVSPQLETILGFSQAEWIADPKLWIDHIFFADRDRILEEEAKCLKTGEPFRCEYRMTDKKGQLLWIRDDAVVVSDTSGQSAYLHGVLYDISERKRAEEAVRESEHRFRMILDTSLDAVVTIDAAGIINGWNKQAESLFGWTREEAIGKILAQTIIPKRYREAHRIGLKRYLETGKSSIMNQRVEVSALHRNGHEIMVELSISPMKSDKNIGFSAFLRDITEHKKSQTQQAALYQIAEKANLAEDLEEFYRAIHNIVGELIQTKNFYIALLDADSEVLTFPYFVDEVDLVPEPRSLGRGLTEYVLRTGQAALISAAKFDELVKAGEVDSIGTPSVDWLGVPLKAGDKAFGALVVQSYTSGRRFGEKEKEVLMFVSQHIASTLERKRSEETIRHQAYHDALTKLPNRVLFRDRMTQALAHAQRRNQMVAMMFLDLDRFKIINDTLGHAVGDKLLQNVAHRLRESLRKEDTVARLGGDEFMLLLQDVNHIESVARIAEKVLNAIRPPFQIDNHELYINTSIGISLYPHDGEDAETLVKNADIALYRAKEKGRDTYQFYASTMNEKAIEQLELENKLRRALERNEFVLHYQPQFDMHMGKIIGMEALVRWQQPDGQLLYPLDFISIAEDTGMIVPLGEWVLRTACTQNKLWQTSDFLPLRVAVNLSGRQFQESLVPTIAEVLKKTGLEPQFLELELTETSIMKNDEIAVKILTELKKMGIQICIDDFGTGYSSLSYLKRFPIDTLKIDQSFIRESMRDADHAAIVVAIITMAHTLKLKVVAEGVESPEQWAFLRDNNCDKMQGTLFSSPLPAEAFTRLITEFRQFKPEEDGLETLEEEPPMAES
jgi:diguanylate cyclase (GGDEF)-like protein/PAS domain S-box-containing protein